MERPACADQDTNRAERERCFDTHEQVFPLDGHRGRGRYPAYTPIATLTVNVYRMESQIRCNIFSG